MMKLRTYALKIHENHVYVEGHRYNKKDTKAHAKNRHKK